MYDGVCDVVVPLTICGRMEHVMLLMCLCLFSGAIDVARACVSGVVWSP